VDDKKQLFFGNMSERVAKIMEEDMEALGAVRKKKFQKPVQAL
jgi:flagellar motor switch protein FliG